MVTNKLLHRDTITEELINDNSADEREMVSNLTEKAL
jgi:hypothetical protein